LDSKVLRYASARNAYEIAVEVEPAAPGAAFGLRPGARIREIVGISPRAIIHYSKRRSAIDTEMDGRCTTAEGTRERVPTARWRRSAQDATLRTRPGKGRGESTEQAVARWQAEDRAAGLHTSAEGARIAAGTVSDDLERLGLRVLRRTRALAPGRRRISEADLHATVRGLGIVDDRRRILIVETAVRQDPRLAVERAVANLTAEHAVFGLDHLELAIGRVLRITPGDRVSRDWHRVRRLAVRAVNTQAGGLRVLTPPALMSWGPTLLRASDQASIYTRHRELRMTTRAVLAAEHAVIAYATRRGAAIANTAVIDAVADELDLSPEKRRALHAALADDRRVTGIVGPAGTGKTYLQRAVHTVAERTGTPVIGLTVGQNAAEVLAAATRTAEGRAGLRTENIAMWLHAQTRPPAGTAAEDWTFRPGQWVIIDEASQASSIDLARLVRLLEPVGGKLILVGDPAQVSAIGPGGLFRYLQGLGNTTELHDVRRFADQWEGPASLRLRAGDTTVLHEYDRRGRFHHGDRRQLITGMLDRWVADILAGRSSLMLVETEADAAQLAARARQLLMDAGVVARGRHVALADGTRASVGDLIVTRRNDRRLTTSAKQFVANRDQWRITGLDPAGGLRVVNTRTGDTLTLPARYVAHHVQLAYAATVDSAQGRTVTLPGPGDDATHRSGCM
jgi:hypothetical protein